MERDFNLLNSTSLSSHYVYYDRLKDEDNEKYKNLYAAVHNKMLQAKDAAKDSRANTAFILNQANREREKELKLIEYMTGFRPSAFDWGKDATNIIDTLNLCLESKDIYDRVSQTILNAGGGRDAKGKQAYSYFGGYLQSTINDMLPGLIEKVGAFNIDQPTIFDWISNEVMPVAIQKMFDANVEEGVDPKLQGAYQELSRMANKFSRSGSFASQLGSIYRIDEVAEEVSQLLADKTKITKMGIKSLTGNKHYTYIRGGLTLEAITDLIFSQFRNDGHGVTGGKGIKADNILTIGIDYSEIENFLESRELGTRGENVDAFKVLGEHLKNVSNGFIVYSSAKNYSITDGFRDRGGFSAGSDLGLGQYEELMGKANKNVKTFIGAIEQLADGAVGQDIDQTDFADIISKNIAYLLFDDYNTIGAGLENGPNAIHIMNLNGLFVPISSILYALADAIENEESIRGIVKTSIKIPKIMYDTNDYGGLLPGEAWRKQRRVMLEDTRIETHFLGNLQNMLKYGQFR